MTTAHTHHISVTGPVVTKQYTTWAAGEPAREWAVLRHLEEHAPGLAPGPVAADLANDPPCITMRRVPGVPLTGRLTTDQVDALAVAVRRLWHVSLPARLGVRGDDLRFARLLTSGPRPGEGVLAAAFDAALAWWQGPDPALLREAPAVTVMGHGDPNLANYLWDGQQVRIVDFEDAALSDPATELAILVEHLSARDMDADRFCRLFDEIDQQRLLATRRLWAMFWLQRLLPGGASERRNPPAAAELQARRLLSLLASSP